MIINLRGTNGSGKSTVAKALLERHSARPVYGCLGPIHPEAYEVGLSSTPLYVLGPYHSATGGLDAMTGRGFAFLVALLERYCTKGHVFFEGVVISDNYGSIGDWLLKRKDAVVVAFLNTPLEVCLVALRARQAASERPGGEKHVAIRYRAILRVKQKMIQAGFRVEDVDRQTAADTILGWLR